MAKLSDVPNWSKRDEQPGVDDWSSSESVCLICGKMAERGGWWMGLGGDLAICTDDYCIERLIHVAFDAWLDKNPSEAPDLAAWWQERTDNVLDRKQDHLARPPDD